MKRRIYGGEQGPQRVAAGCRSRLQRLDGVVAVSSASRTPPAPAAPGRRPPCRPPRLHACNAAAPGRRPPCRPPRLHACKRHCRPHLTRTTRGGGPTPPQPWLGSACPRLARRGSASQRSERGHGGQPGRSDRRRCRRRCTGAAAYLPSVTESRRPRGTVG
jgi:hypothetical protein